MNYNEQTCPVCKKVFEDGDDIVVCPECATPHHRACWAENGRCANHELHGTDFVWKKEKAAAPVEMIEPEQNGDVIVCHICGSENPADLSNCGNCGAFFGEQKQQNETETKCPFCGNITSENARLCNHCGAPLDSVASSTAFFGETPPFVAGTEIPSNKEIVDNITAGDFAIYTRTSSRRYLKKFMKFASGKKFSFNFAALLFSPGWFFYRKIYNAGIFFLVAFTTLAIFTSNQVTAIEKIALKYSEPIETSYNEYYELYSAEGTTEEQLIEKSKEVSAVLSDFFRESLKPYLIIYGSNFILCLICAFVADKLYYKKAVEDLKEINQNHIDSPVKRMVISRKGGLSVMAFLICFYAQRYLPHILNTAAEFIKGLF